MKILYLHQYFNTPVMSGSTRSYEMARRMVERGHEVHMITTYRNKEGQLGKWTVETIDGIVVHWLSIPYANTLSYRNRIKAFIQFALKAGKRAIEVGGDIVFATSTPLTIALPAVKAKKKLGVPMIFEVRDLWPELPIAIGALRSPITKYLAQRLERFAYFNSEHVIGLSPGMSDGIEKTGYPRKCITTIPNSCDLNLFDVKYEFGEKFRAERSWLGSRPLVLYAGTLGHINGVSWLARLAARVKELNPEIRFLVIGEGVDEDNLKSEAKRLNVLNESFFIEKQLPKKQIVNALSAATICTSLFIPVKEMWANSANKFFDALAAGKPVAINYQGWQKSLIKANNIGLYLPYDDLESSAKRLITLIEDRDKCKETGRKARHLAEKKFSRDKLAVDLISIIERLGVKSDD